MTKLAKIVSWVFDPIIISTLTVILIIYQSERDVMRALYWFLIILVVGILPPLLFLVYQKKTGKVTDWFLYQRKERIPIYIATLISLSLALLVIWKMDGPKALLIFSLATLFNSLVLGIATFFNHKPSVHASAATFLVLVLLVLYGSEWWPLLALIPLVAWSRATLKKHTWPQLSAGVFITIFVVLLTLNYFAFI